MKKLNQLKSTPTKEKTVKTKKNPKVIMGFRCDLTLQKEISRLSKESKITPSEWVRLIIKDAIKNKVKVSITTAISFKYNDKHK